MRFSHVLSFAFYGIFHLWFIITDIYHTHSIRIVGFFNKLFRSTRVTTSIIQNLICTIDYLSSSKRSRNKKAFNSKTILYFIQCQYNIYKSTLNFCDLNALVKQHRFLLFC